MQHYGKVHRRLSLRSLLALIRMREMGDDWAEKESKKIVVPFPVEAPLSGEQGCLLDRHSVSLEILTLEPRRGVKAKMHQLQDNGAFSQD